MSNVPVNRLGGYLGGEIKKESKVAKQVLVETVRAFANRIRIGIARFAGAASITVLERQRRSHIWK
jgi:hypothetical protein